VEQEILTNSARTDPESSFKSYDDSVNRFDYVFFNSFGYKSVYSGGDPA